MSRNSVKKIIEKYAEKLKAEDFTYTEIYLFGSYAKGKPNKQSDIDVAVISKNAEKDFNESEDKLWIYAFAVDKRIDPLVFSPKDFIDDYNPLVNEIKKTGIRIV